MDLFKKGTLKSQSLNSRFLASNSNSTSQPRSLPIQPSKPSTHSQSFSSSSASKLKLTTSRQSSSLRLTRDSNASPGLSDAGAASTRDVPVEKKAPVWNKGPAPVKSAKDYTDEELKAMHGISLVARNSNSAGAQKEGRWDDVSYWNLRLNFSDLYRVTKTMTGAIQSTLEMARRSLLVKRPQARCQAPAKLR